jgi:hypothetical protein
LKERFIKLNWFFPFEAFYLERVNELAAFEAASTTAWAANRSNRLVCQSGFAGMVLSR